MPTETTRIEVDAEGIGLRGAALSPRLTGVGSLVEVSLLATRALLLGGDDIGLHVRVGPGRAVRLRDVTATLAYDGRGAGSRLTVDLEVAEGALLMWDAQPLVLSAGSSVERVLTGRCAATGRILLRDTIVCGRTGQPSGALACSTRISREGRPVIAEDLALEADVGVGVLGEARIIDTVTAVGWRPLESDHGACFSLHGLGVIVRDLTRDAHRSGVPAVWERWVGEALSMGVRAAPAAVLGYRDVADVSPVGGQVVC